MDAYLRCRCRGWTAVSDGSKQRTEGLQQQTSHEVRARIEGSEVEQQMSEKGNEDGAEQAQRDRRAEGDANREE